MNDKYKTIKEWAYAYRKAGFNVIPLYNYSKNPSSNSLLPEYVNPEGQKTRGWKPLEKRISTDEEFKTWFDNPSVTGLGVLTGKLSGIVVVDEDSYKANGMSFDLKSPMVVKSARGGKHHYFKYIEPIKTSGFRQGVNIEIKSDGGFIVLPPSKVYINEAKEIGLYTWETWVGLGNLPIIIENDLKKYRPANSEKVNLSELVGVMQGSRHNALIQIANSTFNRFPQKEWNIAAENVKAINDKFNPPLPSKEVEQIIKDSMNFVKNNPPERLNQIKPVEKTEVIFYSQMGKEQIAETEVREKLTTGLRALDDRFSFPTGFYVICANPGAGKGFFATWLARKFFMNYGKKSVMFSLEMGEPLVRARLKQQWSDLTEEQIAKGADTTQAEELMKEDAIVVYPFGRDDTAYQTPENFEKDLVDFYNKGFRIFYFDHLHELEGANVNDRNQGVVETWGKRLQTICKKYPDIWLIIFAQPNKAAEKKKIIGKTDISGSGSIVQKCEFFISLNRNIEVDKDTGMVRVDDANREVIIWIDKNRISSQQYTGARVFLSKTGNFTAYLDDDIQMDSEVFNIRRPSNIDLEPEKPQSSTQAETMPSPSSDKKTFVRELKEHETGLRQILIKGNLSDMEKSEIYKKWLEHRAAGQSLGYLPKQYPRLNTIN